MRLAFGTPYGLLGLASLSLAACSSNAGTVDGDDGTYNCDTEVRADVYHANLEKPGVEGKLDFKLVQSTPAPPSRGNNTWTLEISSMTSGVVGNPVSGATMTVTPCMPDHGHCAAIPVQVTPMPVDAGQYKLDPVNMWMPGLWDSKIDAQAGGVSDTVTFRICIPS